jgi:tetratricopeptide (TPR) repeat protein
VHQSAFGFVKRLLFEEQASAFSRRLEARGYLPTTREACDFFVEIAFGSTNSSNVEVPPQAEMPYFHMLMVAVHEVRGRDRDKFRPVWGGLAYLTVLNDPDLMKEDADALRVLGLLSDAAADRFSQVGHWFSPFGQDGAATAVSAVPANEDRPATAREWYEQARALTRTKQRQQAADAFDRSVALDPDRAVVWANRGTNLLNMGRYEAALESYESALALDPGDPYIHCSRATVYNRTAQPDRALASSREAIAADPDHVGALFNMATALRKLGRDDEADSVLERAYEARPELRPNDP